MSITIEEAREIILSQTRIICELEKERNSVKVSESFYISMYKEEIKKIEALQTKIKELEAVSNNILSHTDES